MKYKDLYYIISHSCHIIGSVTHKQSSTKLHCQGDFISFAELT